MHAKGNDFAKISKGQFIKYLQQRNHVQREITMPFPNMHAYTYEIVNCA